ncbi:hypothetical protein M0R45_019325 [Rubus argutus]|uniref:Uncharacterized protein n=1 Tax=Rubus argutus TaxID=59490 RepID=A0AAW1X5I9_RUBAR
MAWIDGGFIVVNRGAARRLAAEQASTTVLGSRSKTARADWIFGIPARGCARPGVGVEQGGSDRCGVARERRQGHRFEMATAIGGGVMAWARCRGDYGGWASRWKWFCLLVWLLKLAWAVEGCRLQLGYEVKSWID